MFDLIAENSVMPAIQLRVLSSLPADGTKSDVYEPDADLAWRCTARECWFVKDVRDASAHRYRFARAVRAGKKALYCDVSVDATISVRHRAPRFRYAFQ